MKKKKKMKKKMTSRKKEKKMTLFPPQMIGFFKGCDPRQIVKESLPRDLFGPSFGAFFFFYIQKGEKGEIVYFWY